MTVPPNNAGTHGAFRPSRALVVIAATCGWHVYLQHTTGTAHSALRPQLVAKMCLAYKTVHQYATVIEVMGHALSHLADIDASPPPWHN
jgi:hypothetical protein